MHLNLNYQVDSLIVLSMISMFHAMFGFFAVDAISLCFIPSLILLIAISRPGSGCFVKGSFLFIISTIGNLFGFLLRCPGSICIAILSCLSLTSSIRVYYVPQFQLLLACSIDFFTLRTHFESLYFMPLILVVLLPPSL